MTKTFSYRKRLFNVRNYSSGYFSLWAQQSMRPCRPTQNTRAVVSTCVTSLEFGNLQHRVQIKQEAQLLLG